MKFGAHYKDDSLQLCAKFERDIPILNVWFVALTLTWNLANEEIRFSNANPSSGPISTRHGIFILGAWYSGSRLQTDMSTLLNQFLPN